MRDPVHSTPEISYVGVCTANLASDSAEMFIIVVLGSVPTLIPIYERFYLRKSVKGSSRSSGYPPRPSYHTQNNRRMLFPFKYRRNTPRSSTRVYSEEKIDEIGLRDIHVRNEFEVLTHESDSGNNAAVSQNIV